MRVAIVAALLSLLIVASVPALAAPPADAKAKDTRVSKYLRSGLDHLAAARKAPSVARKLAKLDSALDSLHRARGLRRIQGTDKKYAALDRSSSAASSRS